MSTNIVFTMSRENSLFVNFKFRDQKHASLDWSVIHDISLNRFFTIFNIVTRFEDMAGLTFIESFLWSRRGITFPKACWGVVRSVWTFGKGSFNMVTTFRKGIIETLRRVTIRSTTSYSLLCHIIPTMTRSTSIASSITTFTSKTTAHQICSW